MRPKCQDMCSVEATKTLVAGILLFLWNDVDIH